MENQELRNLPRGDTGLLISVIKVGDEPYGMRVRIGTEIFQGLEVTIPYNKVKHISDLVAAKMTAEEQKSSK